ncbi:MAG: type II toxin-antitoxin system HicB family antitoxin [Gammaproteobacteria bacterium]|nr:type II toxin-antitoxin system HicB family antitoxin [Gammaproteobacteria bacterium]
MSDVFKYKGFIGSIEVSAEDKCLYGKLLHVNDLITYEAKTISDLEEEFKNSVTEYLKTCAELKREPQKPFKGTLNVRIGKELHKEVALYSMLHGISINEYIKGAIKNLVVAEQQANYVKSN